jgi:hypothetical protein
MWPGFKEKPITPGAHKSNLSPPPCHARAPHHREARVDTIAGIAWADADEIAQSAKPSIPTHQRAQPDAAHDLIAIQMSPVRPFS